jgi:hypothetical protein
MKGISIDRNEVDVNVPFNHDFVSVYSQSVDFQAVVAIFARRYQIQTSFL